MIRDAFSNPDPAYDDYVIDLDNGDLPRVLFELDMARLAFGSQEAEDAYTAGIKARLTPRFDDALPLGASALDLAKRVELYMPHTLRYVVDKEVWLERKRTGGWEQIDEHQATSVVHGLLEQILKTEYPQLEALGQGDRATALNRAVKGLEDSPARVANLLYMAATLEYHRIDRLEDTAAPAGQILTSDGLLVNLREDGADKPDPSQVILGRAGATFGGEASNYGCPVWMKFLEVAQPDPEVRSYLQRVAGYSLTGEVKERAVFVHSGQSGTGKSTFLDTLHALAGSLGVVPARDVFARKTQTAAGGHNSALVSLAGARLVALDETNDGAQLDEALLKAFASGTPQVARRAYGRYEISFRPVGKVHIATNTPPSLRTLAGMDTRVQAIHWDVRLSPETNSIVAGDLKEHLRERELDGIFSWAIVGAREYYREGLGAPAKVVANTEEYLQDQDEMTRFFEDCLSLDDMTVFTPHADIYAVYKVWAEANGVRQISSIALSKKLNERRLERAQQRVSGRLQRGWVGLRVIQQAQSTIQF